MKKQVDTMIDHLKSISFSKFEIEKMHIYYKLDSNNKLWFLYAGGVIFKGEIYEEKNIPTEP
jgi:hypothetical protein